MRRAAPNSILNLPMVTAIEESDKGFLYVDGKPSLGHMVSYYPYAYHTLYQSMIFIHIFYSIQCFTQFMPMHEKWNSGDKVMWPEDQALEWMGRVLKAGGAWTWVRTSLCIYILCFV